MPILRFAADGNRPVMGDGFGLSLDGREPINAAVSGVSSKAAGGSARKSFMGGESGPERFLGEQGRLHPLFLAANTTHLFF